MFLSLPEPHMTVLAKSRLEPTSGPGPAILADNIVVRVAQGSTLIVSLRDLVDVAVGCYTGTITLSGSAGNVVVPVSAECKSTLWWL
jgi:hypothetical protein